MLSKAPPDLFQKFPPCCCCSQVEPEASENEGLNRRSHPSQNLGARRVGQKSGQLSLQSASFGIFCLPFFFVFERLLALDFWVLVLFSVNPKLLALNWCSCSCNLALTQLAPALPGRFVLSHGSGSKGLIVGDHASEGSVSFWVILQVVVEDRYIYS